MNTKFFSIFVFTLAFCSCVQSAHAEVTTLKTNSDTVTLVFSAQGGALRSSLVIIASESCIDSGEIIGREVFILRYIYDVDTNTVVHDAFGHEQLDETQLVVDKNKRTVTLNASVEMYDSISGTYPGAITPKLTWTANGSADVGNTNITHLTKELIVREQFHGKTFPSDVGGIVNDVPFSAEGTISTAKTNSMEITTP